MMRKEIDKLDFPPIGEYLTMISDAGGEMYGCQMSMDMMKLTKDDLCDEVDDVVAVLCHQLLALGPRVENPNYAPSGVA